MSYRVHDSTSCLHIFYYNEPNNWLCFGTHTDLKTLTVLKMKLTFNQELAFRFRLASLIHGFARVHTRIFQHDFIKLENAQAVVERDYKFGRGININIILKPFNSW